MVEHYLNLFSVQAEEKYFQTLNRRRDVHPRFNARPGQIANVVRLAPDGRRIQELRWGHNPEGRDAIVNAPAEELASDPLLADAFANRRCLIPATGFYLWGRHDGADVPFQIDIDPIDLSRKFDAERDIGSFPGLWWPGGNDAADTFAIVTAAANSMVAPLADRMPAILRMFQWGKWLGDEPATADELLAMLAPPPSDELDYRGPLDDDKIEAFFGRDGVSGRLP